MFVQMFEQMFHFVQQPNLSDSDGAFNAVDISDLESTDDNTQIQVMVVQYSIRNSERGRGLNNFPVSVSMMSFNTYLNSRALNHHFSLPRYLSFSPCLLVSFSPSLLLSLSLSAHMHKFSHLVFTVGRVILLTYKPA